jgi:hypothetical protein
MPPKNGIPRVLQYRSMQGTVSRAPLQSPFRRRHGAHPDQNGSPLGLVGHGSALPSRKPQPGGTTSMKVVTNASGSALSSGRGRPRRECG